MEKYLTFITTTLVVTQILRVAQNAINLHRQNQIVRAQLDEIGEVTDEDMRRKIMIDKMLVEILPKISSKYEEENDA